MKKFLLLTTVSACLLGGAVAANANPLHNNPDAPYAGEKLVMSKPGDLEMSCHEISTEVANMRDIVLTARDMQDDSELAMTGVGVAKTVGSYLVGSLAGGIGIFAAGFLVNELGDEKIENAIELQNVAMQRHSFMTGIYNARGCQGPLDLASLEPAAGDEGEITYAHNQRAPYDFND